MPSESRKRALIKNEPRAEQVTARAAKRKPEVSIIGAGRLGTSLARALAARGYTIKALVAQSRLHARRAAKLSGAHTQPLALASAQLEKLPSCEIFFITTPDDAIAETAARLAAALPRHATPKHATVLHASGALSSRALCPLRDAGFSTGSMHPLIAVSDSLRGAESLREAFYCIEGEPRAVRVAKSIVRDLGAHSFSIRTKDKALYHAAAVMAAGHAVALFDIATEMLARCGLTNREARRVLLPLVESALGNLRTREPARALTGTFARADTETVEKHLEALCARASSDALAAYRLLGQRSLELARKNGADAAALKEIAKLLASNR